MIASDMMPWIGSTSRAFGGEEFSPRSSTARFTSGSTGVPAPASSSRPMPFPFTLPERLVQSISCIGRLMPSR
jgi:hypothetical protein